MHEARVIADILKREGYVYHFVLMMYVNKESKKIFTIEVIQHNPSEWLEEKIAEKTDTDNWTFYSTYEFSEDMKERILGSMYAE